jgi:hypothetical protein
LLLLSCLALAVTSHWASAQDDGIDRPGPPAKDSFETDDNGDGVPDGWYNLRDAKLVDGGPSDRGKCFRFEVDKPGRPARASRAFGVDGKKYEALIIGFWVRIDKAAMGDRMGDEPGLVIDFLGDQLRASRRGAIGPLTRTVGPRWTHVAKRLSVPPDSRDAILSIGLLGATGVMEVDDLTIEQVPIGGEATTNLVVNGNFELGDPSPASWTAENGARRVSPGYLSASAAELTKTGSRLQANLGQPVDRFPTLQVSLAARGRDLRGAEGAGATMFFLDENGRPLAGLNTGVPVFRWTGTFNWQIEKNTIPIPPGARRAVLQVDKTGPYGALSIDDVTVTPLGETRSTRWTPYHEATDTTGWLPVTSSKEILKGSALDVSPLIPAPAGQEGFVTVKDGHLQFAKGGRARFFGVVLLPPAAILEPEAADALADRLARSGVNLLRLGDLDAAAGAARSLIDDSRNDTKELDPESLGKLEHLIAALKRRGIYVAIELQSLRRYRPGDEVEDGNLLPNGGGPAAAFDARLHRLQLDFATKLLTHVNPETGLALKDDPVLAWITLAGELSLFDLIDDPSVLPPRYASALRSKGSGRAAWRGIESHQWKTLAEELRGIGVKVPIAGCSHWRREPEFNAAQGVSGLDLIDDRLYWLPPSHGDPDRRSMLWSRDGGIRAAAASKRKAGHPYVVGQYCNLTRAWALPFESGDLLLAVSTGLVDDWDALTRRGVSTHPEEWGANAPGTGGGEDLFAFPESTNANPQVFGMLPHASTLFLHRTEQKPAGGRALPRTKSAPGTKGWDPRRGRLVLDTPHVQGVAGWFESANVPLENVLIETDVKYAVVIASSVNGEPIAATKRLLITAIGQVEPTGLRYVDGWRRDVADIGQPPLLAEPVKASITWRTKQAIRAYALDNTGKRIREIPLQATADGPRLLIDGLTPGFHWELTSE